jgi:hypothetical protein
MDRTRRSDRTEGLRGLGDDGLRSTQQGLGIKLRRCKYLKPNDCPEPPSSFQARLHKSCVSEDQDVGNYGRQAIIYHGEWGA